MSHSALLAAAERFQQQAVIIVHSLATGCAFTVFYGCKKEGDHALLEA